MGERIPGTQRTTIKFSRCIRASINPVGGLATIFPGVTMQLLRARQGGRIKRLIPYMPGTISRAGYLPLFLSLFTPTFKRTGITTIGLLVLTGPQVRDRDFSL